jgi:hypothetical protein
VCFFCGEITDSRKTFDAARKTFQVDRKTFFMLPARAGGEPCDQGAKRPVAEEVDVWAVGC